ncbi:MAG: cell envelope integrity protein TolA [Gammaproteobacteria bacterium]
MRKLIRLGLLARAVLFTVAVHGALCIVLVYGFTWPDTVKRGGGEPLIAVAVSERDIAGYAERQREKLRRADEAARAARQLDELLRGQKAKQRELAAQEAQRNAAEALQKKQAEQLKEKRAAQEKQRRRAEQEKQRQRAEQRRKAQESREAEEAERRRKAEQKRATEARQKADAARRSAATDALSALVERIAAKVERNWRRPQTSRAGLRVTIRVRVSRDGRVVAAQVTRGSGDPFFDQSAERAVQKASPLPFPPNPQYYEFINTFDFKFQPDAW